MIDEFYNTFNCFIPRYQILKIELLTTYDILLGCQWTTKELGEDSLAVCLTLINDEVLIQDLEKDKALELFDMLCEWCNR